MKKIILVSVCIMALICSSTMAFASTDVNISTGKDVYVGDKFTTTVKYNSDNLSRVKGTIEYDKANLSYISGGTNSGDTGSISFDSASSDGKTIILKIQFTAIKDGSTDLVLNTKDAYNIDEEAIDIAKYNKEIFIIKSGKDTETIENNKPESVKENKSQKDEIVKEDVEKNIITTKSNKTLYFYFGIIGILFLLLIISLIIYKKGNKE